VVDIPQPKDRGIMLKDIIQEDYVNADKSQALLTSEAKTFGYKDMNKFTNLIKRRKNQNKQLPNIIYVDKNKANCILESESRPHSTEKSLIKRNNKGFTNIVYIEKAYGAAQRGRYNESNKIEQQIEVSKLEKSNCLTTVGKDSLVYIEQNEVRVKTNTAKGYDIMTENDCLNLAFPTSQTRRGRVTKGKTPCLLEGGEPLYTLKDYNVRILSKVELCRLQGFPDDYCDILSRNKAESLLGDGWTLPVIEHILKHINN
jgi:site-specific DNA-cytosine methylase